MQSRYAAGLVLAGFLATVLMLSQASRGAVVITVRPVVAPNLLSSPNTNAWMTNLHDAYATGADHAGTYDTPAYVDFNAHFTNFDMTVSSFASWKSQANPGTAFGPAYTNEFGNRLHFSYLLQDNSGAKVDVANGITVTWDGSPSLPFDPVGATSTTYSVTRWGISKGLDNTLWTPDDIIQTSGTGLVDAIVAAGLGNAYPNFGGGTQQQQLDNVSNYIGLFVGYFQNGSVTYQGTTVNASALVLPEPAMLSALILLPVAVMRRR